jgi:hypothetical protein
MSASSSTNKATGVPTARGDVPSLTCSDHDPRKGDDVMFKEISSDPKGEITEGFLKVVGNATW